MNSIPVRDDATIPTFVATGVTTTTDDAILRLTFDKAPPVDGSLALCFVSIMSGLDVAFAASDSARSVAPIQRLFVFMGVGVNGFGATSPALSPDGTYFDLNFVAVSGWSAVGG